MILGDPMRRSLNESDSEAMNMAYRCMAKDDSNGGPVAAPETSSRGLFNKACEGGVRSEFFFPSYVSHTLSHHVLCKA